MLKIGQNIPAFEAELDNGEPFRTSEFKGKKNIVVYFYPKDFARGWTLEARSYRDSYEEILGHDAVLIGVSPNDAESHRQFREQNGLSFNLVSDSDGDLSKLFGVKRSWTFGLVPFRRATFVIDKVGICQGAFTHEINVTRHVDDVLGVLKKLAT